MNLVNKITVKSVFGDPKKYIQEHGLKAPLTALRVVGIATRTQTGESDYGPWVAFKGNFKATNLVTGEQVRSGKMLLPGVASDLIEGALADENAESVSFGFDIIIAPDDASATGYVYQAKPLVDLGEADPLAMLENQIAGQLEAPEKAPKK